MSITPFHELLTSSVENNSLLWEGIYLTDSPYWALTDENHPYWYAYQPDGVDQLVYAWNQSTDPRIMEQRAPIEAWLERTDTPFSALRDLLASFTTIEYTHFAHSAQQFTSTSNKTAQKDVTTVNSEPKTKQTSPELTKNEERDNSHEKLLEKLRAFHEQGEISPSQFCKMLMALDHFGNEAITITYLDEDEPATFRFTEPDGLENISIKPVTAK